MKGLLLFLSIATCLAPICNASNRAQSNDAVFFNYAGSQNKRSVSGGELIKKILPNEAISTYEVQYLDENNYGLAYSGLPEDNSLVNFAQLGNELYAEAKTYSYKSGNITYTWYPSSLEVGNKSISFDQNPTSKQYIAHTHYDGVSEASVKYRISFNLDADKVEKLINAAYLEGESLSNDKQTYYQNKAAYEQYLLDLVEYQNKLSEYIQYQNVVDTYNAYLQELATYNENYQKYLQYLDDVATFEDRVAAYNTYLQELEVYNNNKDANKIEYDAYMASLTIADHQLNSMAILWTPYTVLDSVRVASQMIMGNLVDEVLANKNDLTSLLGVPESLIDDAYVSTCKVRIYLEGYGALTTNEAKYQYYFNHYNFIRQQTEHLLRCLDKLYRWGSVSQVIETKERTTQYIQLVAILAYFCNAIDDFPIYNYEGYNKATDQGSTSKPGAAIIDENWTFCEKTFSQWLNGILIDTTRTGEPKNGTYPSDPVELLVPPTPVPKPVYPSEVTEPVPPGAAPTNPDTLDPVIKPTAPSVVNEPVEPSFSVLDLHLIEGYESGASKQRNVPENLNVFFYEEVNKKAENTKNVAVFHDEDNNVLYYSFFDVGATFVGTEPHKPGDESYVSYVTSWVDENNNHIDLESLDESVSLFPHFEGTDRVTYTITFQDNYGNVLKTVKLLSGDIPSFGGIPYREDINVSGKNYYYEFVGWDREFEPAYSDTTYIASFVQKPYLIVTYKDNGKVCLTQEYKYGEYADEPDFIPNSYDSNGIRYFFDYWDYDFNQPILGDKVINSKYYEGAYTITFIVEGKSYLQWVEKGEVPVYEGPNPVRESSYTNNYKFIGWSKTLNGPLLDSLDPAYEPSRYYAIFEATPIVYADEEKAASVVDADTLVINANGLDNVQINMGSLVEKMRKNTAKPCSIVIDNVEISFTSAQVEMLILANLSTFELIYRVDENSNITIKAVLLNDLDEAIVNESVTPTITISRLSSAERYQITNGDLVIGGDVTSSKIVFRGKINSIFKLVKYFRVSVNYYGKVTITADKQMALPGDIVTVSYEIGQGLEEISAYALTKSNKIIPLLEDHTFTMPNEDVTIFVEVVNILYRLNFYVDNQIVYTITGNYGDIVNLPLEATKASDEKYEYIFAGWDSNDKIITGDKDYHAIFTKIELDFDVPDNKGKTSYSLIVGIAVLGGTTILIVVGLFLVHRFFIKKKTNKK